MKIKSLLALALAAGLAAPALAGDPDAILAAENLEFEAPKLVVGDPAPSLSITNWVKGEEISSFQIGHTYVVEFWATWCGPCIRGMPHLTELQSEHEGDVTVIGVNIWERDAGATRIGRVTEWVEAREDMGYTVAIDGNKKMEEDWMAPAGQNGIPAAFIVDGEGTIAWIGHPGQMDEPLAEIASGEWDLDSAAAGYVGEMKSKAWLNHLYGLFQAKEWAHAYEVAGALLERDWSEDSTTLNQISWQVLTYEAIEERDIAFATRAAERACELTDYENGDILDTLAKAYYMDGKVAQALEVMDKAIEHAQTPEQKEAYEATRAEYAAGEDAR